MKNYYNILNVDEGADEGAIKKAYRKLQMKYHPDKGGDPEKAKEINEAYDCLGDTMKRKQYDMQRNGGGIFGMPGGIPGGGMPGGMDNIFKMFFNQDDSFNMMHQAMHGGMQGGMPGGPNIRIFHNGRPVHMNQKPPEINKTVTISIEDSYIGKTIHVNIERWIQNNNVRKTEKESLYVPIHCGIDNNEIIVVRGKGNVMNNIRSDLKLHIKVNNQTPFKRKGMDLIYEKKLSLKEALVGFSFELKHLNGKTLNINNSGDYIVEPNNHQLINKYGMKRNDKYGNLIIIFKVEFPKALTKQQKEKIKNIL